MVAASFPDSERVDVHLRRRGRVPVHRHDAIGRKAQPVVSRVLRNSRGQTVEVDYGDQTSTIHHYNDTTDLRLNEIETYPTATPTTVLQLYQYTLTATGTSRSVTDYCNESSTGGCSSSQENTTYSATYSYDSRDELVQAIRGGTTFAYSYDASAT